MPHYRFYVHGDGAAIDDIEAELPTATEARLTASRLVTELLGNPGALATLSGDWQIDTLDALGAPVISIAVTVPDVPPSPAAPLGDGSD